MELNLEQPKLSQDEEKEETKSRKRGFEETVEIACKIAKKSESLKQEVEIVRNDSEPTTTSTSKTMAPISPKKRLELLKPTTANASKEKFIYGNYSQYYGYRNSKGFHDIRLDVFAQHKEIFKDKLVLDIGCNSGFITMEVAKQFEVKSIIGLDIDKSLINQAIKTLTKHKKSLPMNNDLKRLNKFPFNTTFIHGNYVLKDDVLLELETEQFDVILCLSITKWIHLNFGDNGLKQAFKRMFLQLKSQGKLILEPQPLDNYGRRKKMTVSFIDSIL